MNSKQSDDEYTSTGILLRAVALLFLPLLTFVPAPPFPGWLNPYSLIIVIPALFVGSLRPNGFILIFAGGVVGALIAPIAFILLTKPIVRGCKGLSKISLAAFIVVTALSYTLAIFGWNSTVLATSIYRAIALGIQALLPPLILAIVYLKSRHCLTGHRLIALHWFALAWFTWSAFPWWGELL